METRPGRARPGDAAATAAPPALDEHGHLNAVPAAGEGRATTLREEAVDRARRLNLLTISWNAVEGVVALVAGVAAGSASLIGFGLDSGIEVSAAVILAWRLHQERAGGCMQENDRRATRAIAVSFALLAAYVGVESVRDLVTGSEPEASVPGIAIAALSLLGMPILARAKRRLAPVLGSRAVEADAAQTRLCAMLSGVLLVGLGANAVFGWGWADPLAGLGIAALAAAEGMQAWRAESLADTCCA